MSRFLSEEMQKRGIQCPFWISQSTVSKRCIALHSPTSIGPVAVPAVDAENYLLPLELIPLGALRPPTIMEILMEHPVMIPPASSPNADQPKAVLGPKVMLLGSEGKWGPLNVSQGDKEKMTAHVVRVLGAEAAQRRHVVLWITPDDFIQFRLIEEIGTPASPIDPTKLSSLRREIERVLPSLTVSVQNCVQTAVLYSILDALCPEELLPKDQDIHGNYIDYA
jgi:hypothetical protein